MTIALALHGGAGARRVFNYDNEHAHMRNLAEAAHARLAAGETALDVVCWVVAQMEASGLYVAGRGGSPNAAGEYELDACVMDGATRRAGAVTCLQGFASPVAVARLVMERTPHVMLCGEGAAAFARVQGARAIPSGAWFTHAAQGESNHAPSGTVGCVARDREGRLAQATSTAGVFDKTPGRVGDTPLIGAGGWADENVAISCTGQGELFIRTAAASQIAFMIRAGAGAQTAIDSALAEVRALGGEGGVIAVTREGQVAVGFNAEGMKYATASADGVIKSAVFPED